VSWRNTLILLAVAALLGAGIWLSNRQQAQEQEAEQQAKRLFGEIEGREIEWVALTTSDGRPARLVRKDGAWRVAEPVDFPADPTAADAIAGALAGLASEAVIDEPQGPEVYGLGEGVRVVRFSAAGVEHELRIGKKTPVGANSYAATGTGEGAQVYTIASYKTSALDKALDDLRERRPLRFEREDVTRIESEWNGGRAVVEKRDGTWKLVEPFAADADESTIETMLSDLAFLRAAGFVDEPPPPAEVGLERPEYRVVLTGKAEQGQPGGEGAAGSEGTAAPRWELAIGSVIEANARAGKAAESALYKIPEDRFQKLPKKVEAFRFKQLSSFVASDAERFELVFHDLEAAQQGASNVVTITGTRTEQGWETTPEPMAAGAAAQLVAELARLDAVDIAADEVGPQELAGLGLSPPHAAIRVYGEPVAPEGTAPEAPAPPDGGEAPLLADLQIGVQSGDRIVARRADRPTIFRMDASRSEHIPVSLEAFRNRFVSKEPPPAAEGEAAQPEPVEPEPAP
jgi:hypothetical protein